MHLLEFLRMQESGLLREFQNSLSENEKEIVKKYRLFQMQDIPLPIDEQTRMRINLMIQSFIDGYRYRVTEEKRLAQQTPPDLLEKDIPQDQYHEKKDVDPNL